MDEAPVRVAAVPRLELNGTAEWAIARVRERRRLGTDITRGVGTNWNGCPLVRFGSTAVDGRSRKSR